MTLVLSSTRSANRNSTSFRGSFAALYAASHLGASPEGVVFSGVSKITGGAVGASFEDSCGWTGLSDFSVHPSRARNIEMVRASDLISSSKRVAQRDLADPAV